MDVLIRLDGPEPLYAQIYEGLRRAILEGTLEPGERIPPTRELADRLRVSRTSVLEAYRQLRVEGYIDARMGSGTYVAEQLPEDMTTVEPGRTDVDGAERAVPHLSRVALRIARDQGARRVALGSARAVGEREAGGRRTGAAPPGSRTGIRYDFRVGRLDPREFPSRVWRRLVTRELDRMPCAYGPAAGSRALREAVTDHIRAARGVRCVWRQVVIVSGGRQAFDFLARLLVDPGDRVVIEEPHYRDARHALVAAGAELIPVPVDEHGLQVERLPAGDGRVRLAYVTPSHQFPTGGVMPLARRARLLAWARDEGAFVIEDDYDAEFQYEVRPIESLQGLDGTGRVLYVGTFSKALSPDLRLGYAVLPESLVEPFTELKRMTDRQSSMLLQRALAEFMANGELARHVRRMRQRYATRREAILDAVHARLGGAADVGGVNAGVHLLLRLPRIPRDRVAELLDACGARGVAVEEAGEHYLSPPGSVELLLGYAALSPREIREGIARLAGAIEGLS